MCIKSQLFSIAKLKKVILVVAELSSAINFHWQ
jgi:hypothetical protein